MDGVKSPLQSLTITAASGSAVAGALSLVGVNIDPQTATDAVNQGCQLVSIVLALVALYGRWRATTRIGKAS